MLNVLAKIKQLQSSALASTLIEAADAGLQARMPGFRTFFRGLGFNKGLVHFLSDGMSRPDTEMLRHLTVLRLHFAARLVAREWADAAPRKPRDQPHRVAPMDIDSHEHTAVIWKAQECSPVPIDAGEGMIFPQQLLRDQRHSPTTIVTSTGSENDERSGRGFSPVVIPLSPTSSLASEGEHGSGSTCPTPHCYKQLWFGLKHTCRVCHLEVSRKCTRYGSAPPPSSGRSPSAPATTRSSRAGDSFGARRWGNTPSAMAAARFRFAWRRPPQCRVEGPGWPLTPSPNGPPPE